MNQGYAYAEQVGPTSAGATALEHLVRRHSHSSAAEWGQRFANGEVELDGHQIAADAPLRAGQWLTWHRPPWDEPEVPLSFDVVYEDADLLIVDKPSGLPTMPAGGFLEHTLLARVRSRDSDWAPLHRLGRGTSGLVACARTGAARAKLQAAFRERAVEKRYLGLAAGRLMAPQLIEVPIGLVPHRTLGRVYAAVEGRAAATRVESVEPRGDNSRALLHLLSGRPHQIRIHLAAVGHPLVGDPLYGPGGLPRSDALPGDLGYALHAWKLGFAHPTTGARLELEAPVPGALR